MAMDRNAHYCKKEWDTIRNRQEKLESSFSKIKAELKAMNTGKYNAEEWRSGLEDRIMEIT